MDGRLYFKSGQYISHKFSWGYNESFHWDLSLLYLLFRDVNKISTLFLWWAMLSLMGTCAGVPAISSNPEALWFTVKITAKALKTFYLFLFFLFCICQVFNANLPLLVTSAFPSSRFLLFSLKRLWSPTDPGDLHRTSLVKCLGRIRRDGWGKEGSSYLCSLYP